MPDMSPEEFKKQLTGGLIMLYSQVCDMGSLLESTDIKTGQPLGYQHGRKKLMKLLHWTGKFRQDFKSAIDKSDIGEAVNQGIKRSRSARAAALTAQ